MWVVVSSTVNLVTDSLQRTCTGTIVIELSGTGWVPGSDGGGSSSGSGGNRDPVTNGYQGTSTVGPQRVTGSGGVTSSGGGSGVNNTPGRQNPLDEPEPEPFDITEDNVHFGPAGIGLLIMGFLVLGCKCFNPTFDMCLSNNMAKEIKQPTCSVYVSASIA